MNNFSVIDFRFAEVSDKFDEKYIQEGVWSRPYEYKYVLDIIKQYPKRPLIHNTSWGYEGVHVTFSYELDVLGDCLHSDIVSSPYRETYYYDITDEAKILENKFDFVLNISTIEHLDSVDKRILAIKNLYSQIVCGGYLILTFDYPRVDLNEIEKIVNTKCKLSLNPLNGSNSVVKNLKYKDLNIVYLTIKKNE